MWPVWVFRLFSLSVTQTQSISPPTKMQLVFGVCSGTATGGTDKVLCPRALGPRQDQQSPGRNSGGESDGGDGVGRGGEERGALTQVGTGGKPA